MRIRRFNEEYNIPMLWDEANKKAVKGYMNIGKNTKYSVMVDRPFTLSTTDREDYASLKMLLLRYDIPFTEKVEKIEDK